MREGRRHAGLLAATLAMLATGNVFAGAVWRNDWFVASPQTLDTHATPGFGAKPTQAVAFADDGEVVVAAPTLSGADMQITRRHVDGSLRWVANLEALDLTDPVAHAIRPMPDGGALLAWGGNNHDYRNRVARIDAAGDLQWVREVPGGWLESSGGRVVSAGCEGVSVIAVDSGDLLWQRELPLFPGYCNHGGMGVDAAGAVYVLQTLGDVYAETGFRLRKYSGDGELLWSVERDDPFGSTDLVGIGEDHAFVRTRFTLEAFDRMSGESAWSANVDVQRVVLSGDGLREPIVAGGSSIRLLAADGSGERWVAPVADARVLDRVGDALLVATPTSRVRLDATTGAVSWSVPDSALQTTWLGFGPTGSGALRAIGRPWPLGSPGLPLIDRMLDASTGAILSEASAVPQRQGVQATRLRDGDGGIVEAAFAPSPTGVQLVSRRVDEATGTTLWQRAEAVPELPSGSPLPPGPDIAIGADAVVVAFDDVWEPCTEDGWAVVSRMALADGATSWRTSLREIDQTCVSASTPAIDDAGNVYASTVANIECPGGANPPCYRRSLHKLAAADGTVSWRRDEVVYDAFEYVFPPQTLLADGNDVLAYFEYGGWLERIAGSDGSVLWQQPLLPGCCIGERLQHRDAQHLIEHSVRYTSTTAATVHWRSIDASSGLIDWSASVDVEACYGIEGCYMATQATLLPDGDLVLFHQRENAARMWRLSGDGSGTLEERLVVPAGDRTEAWIHTPLLDEQGDLWAVLRRSSREDYRSMLSFLARVDPSTGALSEQQAVYGSGAPGHDYAVARPLAADADGHLLAAWSFRAAPDPLSSGLARIDTAVGARGNLSVTIGTDRVLVGQGAALAVHASVRHAGDAPAGGVRAVFSDDWGGGARDASCVSLGGGACTLDLRNGQVVASFDAAAVDGIDVHYAIDAHGVAETHTLVATVQGSLALAEPDTSDNFAHAEVAQALFVDGFEATP